MTLTLFKNINPAYSNLLIALATRWLMHWGSF